MSRPRGRLVERLEYTSGGCLPAAVCRHIETEIAGMASSAGASADPTTPGFWMGVGTPVMGVVITAMEVAMTVAALAEESPPSGSS